MSSADVTGSKPIAVWLQSVCVSVVLYYVMIMLHFALAANFTN
jgi:hypothetical protein